MVYFHSFNTVHLLNGKASPSQENTESRFLLKLIISLHICCTQFGIFEIQILYKYMDSYCNVSETQDSCDSNSRASFIRHSWRAKQTVFPDCINIYLVLVYLEGQGIHPLSNSYLQFVVSSKSSRSQAFSDIRTLTLKHQKAL